VLGGLGPRRLEIEKRPLANDQGVELFESSTPLPPQLLVPSGWGLNATVSTLDLHIQALLCLLRRAFHSQGETCCINANSAVDVGDGGGYMGRLSIINVCPTIG
jgi:hypothetical protein